MSRRKADESKLSKYHGLAKNIHRNKSHNFPCRSLLLSTTILKKNITLASAISYVFLVMIYQQVVIAVKSSLPTAMEMIIKGIVKTKMAS